MKRINSDVAYDYVRTKILNGTFPPGRSLMTNELAQEIGISRTPVKDALRQLETDGLVVVQTRVGAKVRAMEQNEFRELCELRLALEGYAAGLAARNRTRADLLEIDGALQLMILLMKEVNVESDALFSEVLHNDVRFHVTILSAGKNETIKSQILRLHVINRVMSRGTPISIQGTNWFARLKETIDSHTSIYEAIVAGDEVNARGRMEQHIQEVIDEHFLLAKQPNVVGIRELTDEEMNYMALIPR